MGYCTSSEICLSNRYSIFVFLLIIEYNEKLKAKVTEILEEKTQVEEKKQIIVSSVHNIRWENILLM